VPGLKTGFFFFFQPLSPNSEFPSFGIILLKQNKTKTTACDFSSVFENT
jgi:hypothetical protein